MINFKVIWEGLRLKKKATLTSDTAGEMETSSVDNKTYLHNGTTRSPIVTESQSATLTNKVLTGNEAASFTNGGATITLPTVTGGVIGTGDVGTVTSTMIADNTIVNADINSAAGIVDTKLATISTAGKVSNSATTATDVNTPSTIVARDASGNFSAGTITANLTGNASTVTTNANLTGPITSVGNATSIASQTGTGTTFVVQTGPTLVAPNIGAATGTSLSVTGNVSGSTLTSSIATGTPPLSIISTTKVPNLYVDRAALADTVTTNANLTGPVTSIGNVTSIGTGAITSTMIADGTIVDADINASAAIARTKLASGTASALQANNGSGVLSDITDITVGTNNLTLANTKHIEIQDATDSTTTGSNASLAAIVAGSYRLTNASLSSLANIPAGSNGQQLTLINRTGNTISIIDDSSAVGTAANRIFTGLSTSLSLANNSSIIVKYDTTSSRWQVIGGTGSGSSTGGINYITNFNAETGTTGWATYADAAGTSPVDGTGGSPVVTFTRSTSSPLRGTASFLITKDAANRQGNGASYDFTIDAADQGKVLQGSFDYAISSGTYADNDVSIWVYDVTNATLIQPAPYLLKNTTINDKMFIEFQTAINSTSYRLIIHVASTSALAYTIKCDNFNVGPQAKLYGSAVTDWVAYTPTFTGFGTVTNVEAYWRKNGANVELNVKATTGTATATEARVSLPNVTSAIFTQGIRYAEGDWFQNNASASIIKSAPVLIESGVTYVTFGADQTYQNAVSPLTKMNGNTIANATVFTFAAKVPVQGWGSTQVMSSDADTRVVAAIITGDPASATSGNPIIVPTVSYDSHGAYNTSTGRYTVPVSGLYKIFGSLQSASAATTLTIYKGAVSNVLAGNLDSNGEATFIGMINCNAGDLIDIRPGGTVDATNMVLNFEKVSGPAQIAASETVAMSYWLSTNTAASTSTPIKFDTKEYDSHGAYSSSTGQFTAPFSGIYSFQSELFVSATAVDYFIYKNGTSYKHFANHQSAATAEGATSIKLLAGETAEIRPGASVTVSGGALNGATTAKIAITRTGNY